MLRLVGRCDFSNSKIILVEPFKLFKAMISVVESSQSAELCIVENYCELLRTTVSYCELLLTTLNYDEILNYCELL